MPDLKIRVIFDTGSTGGQKPEAVFKAVEGSLKDLENQYKKLESIARSQYAIGSPQQIEATKKAETALMAYKTAMMQFNTVGHQTNAMTANSTMTLQALNYTIRDSPYFFRDFSLGLLAVGNNLNPLIDGLIRMKQEVKEGQTFWGVFKQSLSGTQGVIFALSVLVSVIQAVTFALAKHKSEVKETKDKYEELTTAVNQYSEGRLKAESKIAKMELAKLEAEKEKFERLIDESIKAGAQIQVRPVFGKQADIDATNKTIQILENELATLGDIEKIKRRIEELEMRRLKVQNNPELIQALTKQIEALRESERALMGVTKKTEEQAGYKNSYLIATKEQLQAEIQILSTLEKGTSSLMQKAVYLAVIKDLQKEIVILAKQEQAIRDGVGDVEAKGFDSVRGLSQEEKRKRLQTKYRDISDRYGNLGYYGQIKVDKTKGAIEILKEAETEHENIMRGIAEASDMVGNSISNAFLRGGNAIDGATQALKQFLVQLIAVQSFRYLLTAIFSPTSLPSTFGEFLGFGGSASITPGVPSIPSIPNVQAISGGSALQKSMISRLDAINANFGTMKEPIIMIQADTDAMKFTRRKTNPSQYQLNKGNVSVI